VDLIGRAIVVLNSAVSEDYPLVVAIMKCREAKCASGSANAGPIKSASFAQTAM
jgi:hypothetical protein